MTEITTTIGTYVELWNEPDPERRRDLIGQAFDVNARYQGPLVEGVGHDGLEALVTSLHTNVREHLGGYRFQRTGEIDAHHDAVRFSWEIVRSDDDSIFAAGVDVGVLAADGRLRQVTTFLDVAPEAAGAH
jgi:hypothetical protein